MGGRWRRGCGGGEGGGGEGVVEAKAVEAMVWWRRWCGGGEGGGSKGVEEARAVKARVVELRNER